LDDNNEAAGRCRRNNQIKVMVAVGVNNRRPCNGNGGNEQWHLMVLAMDNDETTGDGCLMDAAMDFGEEVARQRRRRLRSMAAAAGD